MAFLETLPKTNSGVFFVVRPQPLRLLAIRNETLPKSLIYGQVVTRKRREKLILPLNF